MSSKIRLGGLPIENIEDMDDMFFAGNEHQPHKKQAKPKRKRHIDEGYLEERSLKRRQSESYDFM